MATMTSKPAHANGLSAMATGYAPVLYGASPLLAYGLWDAVKAALCALVAALLVAAVRVGAG